MKVNTWLAGFLLFTGSFCTASLFVGFFTGFIDKAYGLAPALSFFLASCALFTTLLMRLENYCLRIAFRK